MKHKHYECIVAWAEGKTIQLKRIDGSWSDTLDPAWAFDFEYRIKPEPKHDHYQQYRIDENGMPWLAGIANLRLYFDGDTNKLKKAEVI